jgi:hypothetical protein
MRPNVLSVMSLDVFLTDNYDDLIKLHGWHK